MDSIGGFQCYSDHSMRSVEALHHGWGGKMASIIVSFSHV
jgi:hypothetical protein